MKRSTLCSLSRAIGMTAAIIAALLPCAVNGQAPAPPATKPVEQETVSDAERVTRLQRAIDDSAKRIEQLKAQRDDPKGDYAGAESAFTEIDTKFSAKKRELQKLVEAGRGTEAGALRDELATLEKTWSLAKERFDLAIQERKTVQEQIATLEQKVQQDRDALGRLSGSPASQPAGDASNAAKPSATSQPVVVPAAPTQESAPAPAVPLTPLSGIEKAFNPGKPGETAPTVSVFTPKPPSAELIHASEEAAAKQQAAQQAKSEAQSVNERLDALRKAIELERRQLVTAQKKAENAAAAARTSQEAFQQKRSRGARAEEVDEVWKQIGEAEQRSQEARAEISTRAEHLDVLQIELADVQQEQIKALREAERREKDATSAQARVAELRNPLAPRNIWRWIVESGPKVLVVILGMAVLIYLTRVLRGRFAQLIAHSGDRGTLVERENRAQTLVSVSSNAAGVAIIAGGVFMILTELGLNILPLLGGAAMIGLAVAFGAQNLIRDYFSGFMILLEHQYGINDVVTIGAISGQVERVTMRITVLRDMEGIVHFIPNGQITTVSNKTHGWSRAVLEIGVAYGTDVDRAMSEVLELARELRRDSKLGPDIVEEPEMLGVTKLGDLAVTFKCAIKTRPGKHWPVRREMLRRINRRFEELHIPMAPAGALYLQSGDHRRSRVVP